LFGESLPLSPRGAAESEELHPTDRTTIIDARAKTKRGAVVNLDRIIIFEALRSW
jgi:hypothetical protein